MGFTRDLVYFKKINREISFDSNYLVPAIPELLQLNNRWQRQIKDERERRRNIALIEGTENEFLEQNNDDINDLLGATEDSVSANFTHDNDDLNFRRATSVTKIIVPNEKTREHIAQQFTLNKNQKAAFMIITGHLDELEKLNEGNMIK